MCPSIRGPGRPLHEPFVVLVVFAVLSAAANWPIPAVAASAMAYPFGDPGLNAWILSWGAQRLPHAFDGVWTAPIFYPYRDTLAFSEHLLGVSIFTAPIFWITGNPTLIYNLVLLAGPILAGTGMYVLARDLSGRRDAAVVAAVAFAFPQVRLAQLTHLQVLLYGWMPWALWFLHRYFRDGTWRHLTGFSACFVLQALSNGYFLYFLSLPAGIVAAHGVWRAAAARWSRVGSLAIAAAVVLAVLAPVGMAYSRVRQEYGFHRLRGDMVAFSADLAAYARVADLAPLRRILPHGTVETALFPGAGVLAGAAVGAWFALSRQAGRNDRKTTAAREHARLYAAIVIAAFVLTLGPEPRLWGSGHLPVGPYGWLTAIVPGMDGLRVPARFFFVVLLGLCVLVAFGVTRLLAHAKSPAATWFAPVASLLVFAEGYGAPIPVTSMPTDDMLRARLAYEWIARQSRGPMIELPAGATVNDIRYMWQTLVHGNRIINGYSGYGSAIEGLLSGPPFSETDNTDQAVQALQVLGVRYIVLHSDRYPDSSLAGSLLASFSANHRRITACRDFGQVHVCEVNRFGAPPASLTPSGVRVASVAFSLRASDRAQSLPALVDGDADTRWSTGRPQKGTEWLEITLDRPRPLTHVRLSMRRPSFGDYPRRLAVDASADGREFRSIYGGSALAALAASLAARAADPGIDVPLDGTLVRVLRLRQVGRTPREWQWAAHELTLWSR